MTPEKISYFCTFSGVNGKAILIESIFIPRNVFFFVMGEKLFSLYIYYKAKFCRRYMTVPQLIVHTSCDSKSTYLPNKL